MEYNWVMCRRDKIKNKIDFKNMFKEATWAIYEITCKHKRVISYNQGEHTC